ncbi:MAG: ABC transporter substrate-binding protein [Candidatus Binataceae bacterium]
MKNERPCARPETRAGGVWRRHCALVLALLTFALPLPLDAQPAPMIPKIGLLTPSSPAGSGHLVEAFRQGFRELGYVEGKTFVLEARYGDGRSERLTELARELVRLKPNVIVTSTDLATAAVRRQSRTIPIVMALSTDPVGTGFVASLARPGGNVTGLSNITAELGGKRLELLTEAVPGLSRVAFLWNPDVRGAVLDYKETEARARSLRLALHSLEISTAEDLDRAFATLTGERVQAFVVAAANIVMFARRAAIARFAQSNRLASMYAAKEYVDAGGLMSYGASVSDMFRRSALYVDKILKGANPGDLPVEQPTKFELVINLKTAKALGLTIPQSLLLRADQVIE